MTLMILLMLMTRMILFMLMIIMMLMMKPCNIKKVCRGCSPSPEWFYIWSQP